jgi:hypothetical protein
MNFHCSCFSDFILRIAFVRSFDDVHSTTLFFCKMREQDITCDMDGDVVVVLMCLVAVRLVRMMAVF